MNRNQQQHPFGGSKKKSGGGGGFVPHPPPKYIPGLGRGAVGFTTRSDVGPAAPAGDDDNNNNNNNDGGGTMGSMGPPPPVIVGSRSAEVRAMLKQQQQNQQQNMKMMSAFGAAPADYIPGAGRGAGRLSKDGEGVTEPTGSYDSFNGYVGPTNVTGNGSDQQQQANDSKSTNNTIVDGQFDQDDDEADQIWAAIDERMNQKKRKKKNKRKNPDDDDDNNNDEEGAQQQQQDEEDESNNRLSHIGSQFRELKEKLADVSEDQWASIPDVGDHSLKYKQQRRQQDVITPLTDSLLAQRSHQNNTMLSINHSIGTSGTGTGTSTSVLLQQDGMMTSTNMAGLSAARKTVLGMSLDKMSDSILAGTSTTTTTTNNQTGTTTTTVGTSTTSTGTSLGTATSVDPVGYLTSLSSRSRGSITSSEIGDIHKARLLLKSVRETNPHHAPGWIASARVEEAAQQIIRARYIIQEACTICKWNEDIWLEAARLHPLPVAKSILATAVRQLPNSVSLYLKAADLETTIVGKRLVLRKGLEMNSTSLVLWQAAIELESNVQDVKILLQVAVQKIPTSMEMWLALARLESYEDARKVLNKARQVLPAERMIWISAAKLEEAQIIPLPTTSTTTNDHMNNNNNKDENVSSTAIDTTTTNDNDNNNNKTDEQLQQQRAKTIQSIHTIIERAVKSLAKYNADVSRAQWIQEAENAEKSNAIHTCAAIIQCTISQGVDEEDQQRTWMDDAKNSLSKNYVHTARAIIEYSLLRYPTKKSWWLLLVELETKYGTFQSLDEVLKGACIRIPKYEIFWLVRAKEQWNHGNVDMAREILTSAFAANPNSETVWLAAAKLEWENGEYERARVLFQRARDRAPTQRVYMKSALLEWECKQYGLALQYIEEGITLYPQCEKLYYMGGQICSIELDKIPSSYHRAIKFYQRGIQSCRPNSQPMLWIYMSQLEEIAHTFVAVVESSSSQEEVVSVSSPPPTEEPLSTTTTTEINNSSSTTNITQNNNKNNNDKIQPKNGTPTATTTNISTSNTNPVAGGATNIAVSTTKARSILEMGRLQHPKNPFLWLASIRLERKYGNYKLAETLMAKALQNCSSSNSDAGILLGEQIDTVSRIEKKGKATTAIQRCPDDPYVIGAVATLFTQERKSHEKARKWFERAIILDPDNGDSWIRYYVFEYEQQQKSQQQQKLNPNSTTNGGDSSMADNNNKNDNDNNNRCERVRERFITAAPKHGEYWPSIVKDMKNRKKTLGECLHIAALQWIQTRHKK